MYFSQNGLYIRYNALILKVPLKIVSDDILVFYLFLVKNKTGYVLSFFCLREDSHEISTLTSSENGEKNRILSAAVVAEALKVK